MKCPDCGNDRPNPNTGLCDVCSYDYVPRTKPAPSKAEFASSIVGCTDGLGDPVAWMRRWHYEKEKEYKVLNPKTGRMMRHRKFNWLPVTLSRVLEDDIPLYMSPNVRLTD